MCGTISRVGDEDGDVYGECTNTRRDDKGDGESRRKDDVARILSAARNGEMIERSFAPPALVARSDNQWHDGDVFPPNPYDVVHG